MSEKRAKRQRLHERALDAERKAEQLADLLLLHKAPLRCRIRKMLLPASPSAAYSCRMLQPAGKNKRHCDRCRENMSRDFAVRFCCGLYREPYPLALAKEVQGIYEEG